jgi:peptidoglycan/xylan/chitin deacetylase (PgdA/CDA1 family)
MKRTVRKGYRKSISWLPFPALKILAPRRQIDFFYHVVSSAPLPHVRHLYPYRTADQFEQDLIYIAKHYSPIGAAQLEKSLQAEKVNGKLLAHVSFDDGFSECFDTARTLLQKHKIPATFFLVTNFVDNRAMYYRNKVSLCIDKVASLPPDELRACLSAVHQQLAVELDSAAAFKSWVKSIDENVMADQVCSLLGIDIPRYLAEHQPYLTSAQVRQLAADGFTIGAHSQRHVKFNRLSEAEIAVEILGSCQFVTELTGQQQVPFSFPHSGEGVSRDFLADLRRQYPQIGLIFDTKGIRKDRPFVLNRVWVESPRFNPDGRQPLATVLRRAYQESLAG